MIKQNSAIGRQMAASMPQLRRQPASPMVPLIRGMAQPDSMTANPAPVEIEPLARPRQREVNQ